MKRIFQFSHCTLHLYRKKIILFSVLSIGSSLISLFNTLLSGRFIDFLASPNCVEWKPQLFGLCLGQISPCAKDASACVADFGGCITNVSGCISDVSICGSNAGLCGLNSVSCTVNSESCGINTPD